MRENDRHAWRSALWLRRAERLLTITGGALLIGAAALITDAELAQIAARRSLEIPSVTEHVPTAPAADLTSVVAPARPLPARGDVIAALSIPNVALSAMVLHGSDGQTLRRGPGHLEQTPLPGEPGNVVIAGHRDSFFRPLQHVRVGDAVLVDTQRGRMQYRVTALRIVHARDLSVLESTAEETLTLITCYPFWALGEAPDRFVVRATRVRGAGVPAKPDDDAQVRHAIERFRLTYNARFGRMASARQGAPLAFEGCEIAITGNEAIATCAVASGPDDAVESGAWRLRLTRAGGRWAMVSVQSS